MMQQCIMMIALLPFMILHLPTCYFGRIDSRLEKIAGCKPWMAWTWTVVNI